MTHDGSAEIRWFCCQSVKPFFIIYYLCGCGPNLNPDPKYLLYHTYCTMYSVAEPVRSLPGPTTLLLPQKVGFQLL